MEKSVLFTTEGQIAVITLNRPERRNSLNQDLLSSLYDSIDKFAADDNLRVAIITGNGKSFCSGVDLASIATDNLFDPRGDGNDMRNVFESCKKPIIGAVNGHAITGGFELALNCDFLIASEKASFADTHSRVGIHPGWGMTQLLQETVGQRMAKQISLTCQFIRAEEALRIGLVNEVTAPENLIPRTMEIAGNICEGNQNMLGTVKELIEFKNNSSLSESLQNEKNKFDSFISKHLKN